MNKLFFIITSMAAISIITAGSAFCDKSTKAPKLPTMASGNYAAFCKSEWTKRGVLNNQMFNYCIDLETEGYKNLVYLVKQYSNQPWIQDAVNKRVKEWTKKGSRRDQMVHSCLKDDVDGFEEFKIAKKQPGYNQKKANACQQEWYPDYKMAWYCYQKD